MIKKLWTQYVRGGVPNENQASAIWNQEFDNWELGRSTDAIKLLKQKIMKAMADKLKQIYNQDYNRFGFDVYDDRHTSGIAFTRYGDDDYYLDLCSIKNGMVEFDLIHREPGDAKEKVGAVFTRIGFDPALQVFSSSEDKQQKHFAPCNDQEIFEAVASTHLNLNPHPLHKSYHHTVTIKGEVLLKKLGLEPVDFQEIERDAQKTAAKKMGVDYRKYLAVRHKYKNEHISSETII